jgi:hypothetical protein
MRRQITGVDGQLAAARGVIEMDAARFYDQLCNVIAGETFEERDQDSICTCVLGRSWPV